MRLKTLILWATTCFGAGVVGCGSGASGEQHDGDHGDGPGEKHGDEDLHAGEVHLDAHVIERNGIELQPATKRLLLGALELPAEVQVNPDRKAHVTSLAPGRLSEIRAALGDEVAEGDVLAVVSSVELGLARARLADAQARKRAADAERERLELLTNEGIAAKKSFIEARSRAESASADVAAARASLSVYGGKRGAGPDVALRSPISGTVIERHASPGEVIDTSSTPFVVADLTEVWVMGRVYEQELGRVSEGMAAEVALIAYPGRTWKGVVDYVSSTLDEDTRTVSIRVVLRNEEGVLRPGLFGTIAVGGEGEAAASASAEVLSVPSTAVSTIGDRTVVFVAADEPNAFVARDVVPGARAHGLVEIKEGLKEDEPVVTSGAFVLKSELLKDSLGEGHAH